jgi:hypothetical protein
MVEFLLLHWILSLFPDNHSPRGKISVDLEGIFWHPYPQMTKDQLISLIKKILGTNSDLKILAKLDLAELKLLVACTRERIEGE